MTRDSYGDLVSSLAIENDKRICLLVMDGVGGGYAFRRGASCPTSSATVESTAPFGRCTSWKNTSG
ncbi:hypothetical protein LCGC14_0285240 [marine sediment metagenome]|uniref:Uncharacterized protein n=1 Tax=marine sediment metagenome TaxID=412755 RepID=A0A0F9TV14_9ZZZZ